eukprot:CAMPEP_0204835150 /NCGR_PEP_ID=MMETSP1346-20131115/21784_1 /ASSEMBLY_ACC=CAM_ASM_000771 /TAXON_ID=215587 /ORGANISM="Aplanochytrium stocchinoi, Strain GSBS06" /LENGTH=85 /DNA_ID=CAMNT_0051968913 /DNA_START=73 /DNA_END=327 /DNA_ORIENTATION=-
MTVKDSHLEDTKAKDIEKQNVLLKLNLDSLDFGNQLKKRKSNEAYISKPELKAEKKSSKAKLKIHGKLGLGKPPKSIGPSRSGSD